MTLLAPREARAATVSVDLVAEGSFKTMVDGVSIFTWRFRGSDGAGPGALSSGLAVGEGDTINVTVTNDLDRPINWVIPGVLDNTAPVSPGASRTYTFSAPAAGSYFFTDGVNGDIGRAMGLSGPLVVMPDDASNLIYTGGPGFDRQYTLVLSELDDRLNSAVQAGGSYNMADYEPNYFFVNGLGFPATRSDSDTLVKMNVGEDVAMRFINAGCITNPMHFHGYHVKVATRNRAPVTDVIDKDTVLVGLGECVDVILRVNQPGDFPLHTHFLPGVTANGVYVNPYGGALITLSAA
jgi:FtsP/CotA-like multicopper oxidase with cupredoxin domain